MKLWRLHVSLDVICDSESADISVKGIPQLLEKELGVLKVHAAIVHKDLLLNYDPHMFPGTKEP